MREHSHYSTDALDIVGMVESLQMDWQLSDPKEVMLLLVRQARDRERQESPLLTLLEELEHSGVTDPVAYCKLCNYIGEIFSIMLLAIVSENSVYRPIIHRIIRKIPPI